jgi:hypothetical protein
VAKKEQAVLSFTAAQAAAFRLARHHLGPRTKDGPRIENGPRSMNQGPRTIVEICRDTGGIQAQVMSAAEMALWARRRTTTREEIQKALWTRRDVVRTSAMRLTLHLIPAGDLSTFIAALRPMSSATLRRWQERVGAKPDQVAAMIETILEALGDGPKTQQELIARTRKKAGKGVRAWLEHAWSAVRPAVIEGLIVYGPPRGCRNSGRLTSTPPAPNCSGVSSRRSAPPPRTTSRSGRASRPATRGSR